MHCFLGVVYVLKSLLVEDIERLIKNALPSLSDTHKRAISMMRMH